MIVQNFTRDSDELNRLFPRGFYYTMPLCPGWRGVVLNTFDLSLLGFSETEKCSNPDYVKALELLTSQNPNNLFDGSDWTAGLTRENARFLPYNGGILKKQLDWLHAQLSHAREHGDRVVVFTHVKLFRGRNACEEHTLLWNADAVTSVLEDFGDVVAGVVGGHDHCASARTQNGIRHVVLASPLETQRERASECAAELWLQPEGPGAVLVSRGALAENIELSRGRGDWLGSEGL